MGEEQEFVLLVRFNHRLGCFSAFFGMNLAQAVVVWERFSDV